MLSIRPCVAGDEVRRQHAHEAGQHDQLRLAGVYGGGRARFRMRAWSRMPELRNAAASTTAVAIPSVSGALHAGGGGLVGDHDCDFGWHLPAAQARAMATMLVPLTRDQDAAEAHAAGFRRR